MRRNDSEINRNRNIKTVMIMKATSEDTTPASVLRFFFRHRTPGQRTIDIPNIFNYTLIAFGEAIPLNIPGDPGSGTP